MASTWTGTMEQGSTNLSWVLLGAVGQQVLWSAFALPSWLTFDFAYVSFEPQEFGVNCFLISLYLELTVVSGHPVDSFTRGSLEFPASLQGTKFCSAFKISSSWALSNKMVFGGVVFHNSSAPDSSSSEKHTPTLAGHMRIFSICFVLVFESWIFSFKSFFLHNLYQFWIGGRVSENLSEESLG